METPWIFLNVLGTRDLVRASTSLVAGDSRDDLSRTRIHQKTKLSDLDAKVAGAGRRNPLTHCSWKRGTEHVANGAHLENSSRQISPEKSLSGKLLPSDLSLLLLSRATRVRADAKPRVPLRSLPAGKLFGC